MKRIREAKAIAKKVHPDFRLVSQNSHLKFAIDGPNGRSLVVVSTSSSDVRAHKNARMSFIRACAASGLQPGLS